MVQNSLVIAALAAGVVGVSRALRLRPAVEHALWLVLLVKFLVPPVVAWPWRVGDYAVWHEASRSFTDSTSSDAGELIPLSQGDVPTPSQAAEVDVILSRLQMPPPASLDVKPAEDLATARPSSETNSTYPTPGGVPWQSIFLTIWAIGAAVLTTRRTLQICRVHRRLRVASPAPDWVLDELARAASFMRVRAPVAVVTSAVDSPCLWCLGRPVLLWPVSLAHVPNRVAWRGVIAHELAHLRRRDHWVAWLVLAVGCLWWFNPVFWFVRARLRAAAELACDAWAVAAVPGEERSYAQSLVEVTRRVSRATTLPSPALGAGTRAGRSLERRLTMIFSAPRPYQLSRRGLLAACALSLLALPAWSLDPARARDPDAAQVAAEPSEAQPAQPAADPAVAAPPQRPAEADRITRLERQIDALLTEVRNLRESRARSRPPADSSDSRRAVAPDGKLLAIIDGRGQVTLRDAVTGKELFRTKLSSDTVAQSIAFSPDGKHLAVQGEGKIAVLDAATGKVLRVTDSAAAPSPAADARPPRLPSSDQPATATKIAEAGQASHHLQSGASLGGVQLDLIRLATEYSDASGKVMLAERLFELAKRSRSAGEMTEKDAVTAEISLHSARQKLKLLGTIAEAAAQAAKTELAAAEQRYAAGQVPQSEIAQARAKLEILMQILRSK